MPRPLLFLDVDGTLARFGGQVPGHEADDGALARIDRALGPKLAALPCELVWATAWMEAANELVSPWLGLPALPVVEFRDEPAPRVAAARRLHWKTPDLVAYAGGRPFVWVDDEVSDDDRAFVAEHHDAPCLLHHVRASLGLTDDDLAAVRRWLDTLGEHP